MSSSNNTPNKRRPAAKPSADERVAAAGVSEATHEIEREHESPAAAAVAGQTVAYDDADVNWSRPSSLDAPPPRPGYVQRWKRHQLGGGADTRNWQRAMREGWRPRPADSVDSAFSSLKTEVHGQGVISAEGLILCEMPATQAGQRRRFYSDRTARQMASVDSDLHRTQAPGGPAIKKDHESQAEFGRRPRVAGD